MLKNPRISLRIHTYHFQLSIFNLFLFLAVGLVMPIFFGEQTAKAESSASKRAEIKFRTSVTKNNKWNNTTKPYGYDLCNMSDSRKYPLVGMRFKGKEFYIFKFVAICSLNRKIMCHELILREDGLQCNRGALSTLIKLDRLPQIDEFFVVVSHMVDGMSPSGIGRMPSDYPEIRDSDPNNIDFRILHMPEPEPRKPFSYYFFGQRYTLATYGAMIKVQIHPKRPIRSLGYNVKTDRVELDHGDHVQILWKDRKYQTTGW